MIVLLYYMSRVPNLFAKTSRFSFDEPHNFAIVRKHKLPQSSVPLFLVLKVEILNIYESRRCGQAAPCREKTLKTYEDGNEVNQVNILNQAQVAVAEKYSFEI